MNQSWEQKKKTSSTITESEIIQEMDSKLCLNKTVLSHKLCGAGNGGFFLTFSEKGKLNIPYHSVKIEVSSQGVSGQEV
jgi:galactokinase/mevalonate kinase-like predicted kinase